jgi:hypothetical protein
LLPGENAAKLKKRDHVSNCKGRLMIMKWVRGKDSYLISTTHCDKMVPTWIRGLDMEKSKVIADYPGMGGVDLSDT